MSEFKIRQLKPEDWKDYREIRLEALRVNGEFFCPSKDNTKFTEADWTNHLENPNSAIFGIYKGSQIVGLTGIVRENNDANATSAQMVMSYIKKEFRGQGLSKMFYDARIAWAKSQSDIKTLVVEHRDDNFASEGAHKKFGFEYVGSSMQAWPDGQSKPALIYQLKI